MIDGVLIEPLRVIPDERGRVMHMMRADSPHFTRFGEIYFSLVYPDVVKAWKRHRLMTQNYAVPVGAIKVVIYDGRPGSKTEGQVQEVDLGEDNYRLLRIPPMVWSGFRGISPGPALVANCPDMPHDPTEVDRLPSDDPSVPYRWAE